MRLPVTACEKEKKKRINLKTINLLDFLDGKHTIKILAKVENF